MPETNPEMNSSEEIIKKSILLEHKGTLKEQDEFLEKKWRPAEQLKELFEELKVFSGIENTKEYQKLKQKWLK